MKALRPLAVLALSLFAAAAAQAHKSWLLPSATVLTQDQWITVDAAVSNDLFYFNHVPLRLDNLEITAPDGSTVQAENPFTGKFRSSFDLHLAKPGTYRLALVNSGLFASYELNGEKKRWRGKAEDMAREIPADAKNVEITQSAGRVETFATAGAPNETALKATGKGLELVPLTHPNDLFAGEAARFRFTLDGKPAADLAVEIVPGGSRWRNAQNEIALKTDRNGEISVTWPAAGMYWLETGLQDKNVTLPKATSRRASYVATFEVLAQ
ncbi:MAG: ABC transporter permease [Lysobacterales bacterium 69-70]|nr:DUF4198 domain-containing protein [Xanthomonadaceae bacterium]ODU34605.1 MAG: ABC transporter permease [Xanthomonadaceae bacterium SCN 69-320]ODV19462.1 MAG: ABC transporter permease [Xanthomonadaceae bacterium SCN 69-25]OJY94672.1 MAG: ABC transporter permease [Xanthomonadales bacterium 69-70]